MFIKLLSLKEEQASADLPLRYMPDTFGSQLEKECIVTEKQMLVKENNVCRH
jgi:hypothetical protein